MDRRGHAAARGRGLAGAAVLGVFLAAAPPPAGADDTLAKAAPEIGSEETPARLLFGKIDTPAALPAEVIGSYAKGCLAGAVRLPTDGPGYQTMRPSRNRAWGHPDLLAMLERLAAALNAEGFKPILIGDLAQPRGGPMLSGHASHQGGLDADIWFRPSPDHRLTPKEREEWSAYSVVKSIGAPWVNENFGRREARLIELAASDPRTARVFVSASIKKALCEAAGPEDRTWLSKVRPWYGHRDHLHVRLDCPAGAVACTPQAPPAPDDGCGAELASWLQLPKPKPPGWKPPPRRPKPEILLSNLPEACTGVLGARSLE